MSDFYSINLEIEAERRRQIVEEGYTAEHDDAHQREDLMEAAIAYYDHATGRAVYQDGIPRCWPWERAAWKPKDKRRDLIRAGALCLAEQDQNMRDLLIPQALPEQYLANIVNEIARLDAEKGSA